MRWLAYVVGVMLVRYIAVQVGIDKGAGARIGSGRSMQYLKGIGAEPTAALAEGMIWANYRAIKLLILWRDTLLHIKKHNNHLQPPHQL